MSYINKYKSKKDVIKFVLSKTDDIFGKAVYLINYLGKDEIIIKANESKYYEVSMLFHTLVLRKNGSIAQMMSGNNNSELREVCDTYLDFKRLDFRFKDGREKVVFKLLDLIDEMEEEVKLFESAAEKAISTTKYKFSEQLLIEKK